MKRNKYLVYKAVVFSFICFYSFSLFSQSRKSDFELPENKFKEKPESQYGKVKSHLKYHHRSTWIFSYHKSSFLNTNFAGNIDNNNIKQKFGTSLNYRFDKAFPFIFDINWFASKFVYEGSSVSSIADTPKIRHRGIELAANFSLLPTSKFFMPYIGVGYQTASIVASNYWPIETMGEDQQQSAENQIEYSSNCSTGIWKVGVTIGGTNLFVNAEYKQSLFLTKSKSFNQLSVGIGIRLY
jgi:outer membrane receptor protein involved in Fe transport